MMEENALIKKDGKFSSCKILGVNVSVLDMQSLVEYTDKNLKELSGKYFCFTNVHTLVKSYEDKDYREVQNGADTVSPDGAPVAKEMRRRGFSGAKRTAGPDFMESIFSVSAEKGYRHYFYGTTEDTLQKLVKNLSEKYKGINIVGSYAPPFRELTEEEDQKIVKEINNADADFVWIGIGAPKQEIWMANHKDRIKGLMLGVGAGFDFHAGTAKRAPKWMQKLNLEWLYRLIKKPKLLGRYLHSNPKFIWKAVIRKK